MVSLKSVAEKFARREFPLKSGTLKFFGQWFGRPMDNCHRITDFRFDEVENVLEIHFDAGERLLVWNPANYSVGEQEFTIKEATKVRWEWYHYGGTQSRENLYSIEYVKQESYIQVVSGKIGADYTTGKQLSDSREPAVEIC